MPSAVRMDAARPAGLPASSNVGAGPPNAVRMDAGPVRAISPPERMRTFDLVLSATLAAGLAFGCGGDDDAPSPSDSGSDPTDAGTTPDLGSSPDASVSTDGGSGRDGGGMSFPQPANTVPVNFVIDDSANRSYTPADGLAWRGTFEWDPSTRILGFDGASQPPYPLVYDDGPWTGGGHEPDGAIAGDGIWGVTGFVVVPDTAPLTFEYDAIEGSSSGSDGTSIWIARNEGPGTFTVDVGASAPIDAPGLVLRPWGDIDVRIRLDTGLMDASFRGTFDPSRDAVEIQATLWNDLFVRMTDDGTAGDGAADDLVYTFQLLERSGPGTALPHTGGLRPTDELRFALRIGGRDYVGPVDVGGTPTTAPLTDGIIAEARAAGSTRWSRVTLVRRGSENRTTLVAPD